MSHPIADIRVDTSRAAPRRGAFLIETWPGLAACGIAAGIGIAINKAVPAANPLLIAIVAGAFMANLAGVPERLTPGLRLSSKHLLRAGIALLGLQLMVGDILSLGWGVILMVIGVVVLGVTGTLLVGRYLGVAWSQRILIACGFSICGAAAVAATNDVVDGDEEEVLTAIALVVLFGAIMIPVIPLLSGAMDLSDRDAGLWAGGCIHEVAQVVAAGGTIGGGALAVAVAVKLARVLMLVPVISILTLQQRRRTTDSDVRRPPVVPLFVLAFSSCVGIRATGVLPDSVVRAAQLSQTVLLTAAMFALGAGVRIATIRKLGPRPVLLAIVSTVWIAAIALLGVKLSA